MGVEAKPFLKWAGGKRQLIEDLEKSLSNKIKVTKQVDIYIEPFVGGGAFFFYLYNNYKLKKAVLLDINKELVLTYKVIKRNSEQLIKELKKLEEKYLEINEEERKNFYYKIRDEYNKQMSNFNYENYNEKWIIRSAYLIFLNKTCFNGLFRQNKKGEFNVPIGRYKNPKICDKDNILAVSKALQLVKIVKGDFNDSKDYIKEGALIYLDPPYKPINGSGFTKYSKEDFNDQDQIRLAEYFKEADKLGAFLILSNSDPKNEDPKNDYFEKLYSDFNIIRVNAKRSINCKGSKRGEIKELIIRNY